MSIGGALLASIAIGFGLGYATHLLPIRQRYLARMLIIGVIAGLVLYKVGAP